MNIYLILSWINVVQILNRNSNNFNQILKQTLNISNISQPTTLRIFLVFDYHLVTQQMNFYFLNFVNMFLTFSPWLKTMIFLFNYIIWLTFEHLTNLTNLIIWQKILPSEYCILILNMVIRLFNNIPTFIWNNICIKISNRIKNCSHERFHNHQKYTYKWNNDNILNKF